MPQVDAEFTAAESLQALPRHAFALLRSPLLTPARPGQHPDLRAAQLALWAALPPRELRAAVYPSLSSFSDPDTQVRL